MSRYHLAIVFLFVTICTMTACRPSKEPSVSSPEDKSSGINDALRNKSEPRQAQPDDTNQKRTAMQLTADAIENMRQGDTEAALFAAQQAVALEEENFDARWHLMLILQDRGINLLEKDFKKEGYDDLLELNKHVTWLNNHLDRLNDSKKRKLAFANYNVACALARNQQPDQALDSLKMAIELGYDDYEKIKSDPDLDSLRELERYKQLVEKPKSDAPTPDSSQPFESADSPDTNPN
jgi:tetratricopeptide (TPR) repeat protein